MLIIKSCYNCDFFFLKAVSPCFATWLSVVGYFIRDEDEDPPTLHITFES